jgi:hypothetical protein
MRGKNIRKEQIVRLDVGSIVAGRERSALHQFLIEQLADVQIVAKVALWQVTRRSDYQSACPLLNIRLNAIYSYSYRGDSTRADGAL